MCIYTLTDTNRPSDVNTLLQFCVLSGVRVRPAALYSRNNDWSLMRICILNQRVMNCMARQQQQPHN